MQYIRRLERNEYTKQDLGTYRQTTRDEVRANVYEPALLILGQGKKVCYVDGRQYDYGPAQFSREYKRHFGVSPSA